MSLAPLIVRSPLARRLAWAAFVVVAFGPLAGALWAALAEATGSSATGVSALEVFSPRRLELLARSVAFSAGVAVSATALGVAAGLGWLAHWPAGARRAQVWLLASVALPPTVPALAFSRAAGALAAATGVPTIGQTWCAAAAQGAALFPFCTGLAILALGRCDPLLLDAARVQASPWRVLGRVALPLARPTLAAGAMLVFLLSLLDYTMPSIFGVNVYALEIFVVFSATHRLGDALWLALPLAALALAVVAWGIGVPRQLAQQAVPGSRSLHGLDTAPAPPSDASAASAASDASPARGAGAAAPAVASASPFAGLLQALPTPVSAALVLAALASAVAWAAPVLALGEALARPEYLMRTLQHSGAELVFTAWTSAAAALGAVLLALVPALTLAFGDGGGPGPVAGAAAARQWSARATWALVLLPYVVPPALTGIGLIGLWRPWGTWGLYGTAGLQVAAELARFTPIAVVVLAAAMQRLDPVLLEAALVGATSMRRALSGVMLPLISPGLGVAAALSFVLSLGEIGASLLVAPAGSATLSMKTYNYLHYGGSAAAGGLCLMLLALAAAGAMMAAGLGGLAGRAHRLAGQVDTGPANARRGPP